MGREQAPGESGLDKHGLDFANVAPSFFESARIYPGKKNRFVAVGRIGQTLITAVVFMPLGAEALSIVSMRPASRKERKDAEDAGI